MEHREIPIYQTKVGKRLEAKFATLNFWNPENRKKAAKQMPVDFDRENAEHHEKALALWRWATKALLPVLTEVAKELRTNHAEIENLAMDYIEVWVNGANERRYNPREWFPENRSFEDWTTGLIAFGKENSENK
jgi:hypothetical protein